MRLDSTAKGDRFLQVVVVIGYIEKNVRIPGHVNFPCHVIGSVSPNISVSKVEAGSTIEYLSSGGVKWSRKG